MDGWSGTSVPAWDKRLSAMSHNVPRTKRDKRPHMGQTRRAGFRPMSPDSTRRPRHRYPSALQSRQPFAPVPRRLAGFVASPSKTALQAVRRSAHVRARLKRAVRFASRPRPVCNAISASRPAIRQPFDRGKHRTRQTCRRIRRQSIRQPFDRGATYPATVCQLPPSNAATYPATLNAATVRNRSRRIPANVSRDRAPPVSHSAAVPSH